MGKFVPSCPSAVRLSAWKHSVVARDEECSEFMLSICSHSVASKVKPTSVCKPLGHLRVSMHTGGGGQRGCLWSGLSTHLSGWSPRGECDNDVSLSWHVFCASSLLSDFSHSNRFQKVDCSSLRQIVGFLKLNCGLQPPNK